MEKFDFQNELKQIIKAKDLVEVRFFDAPKTYKVALLLDCNTDFITLIEIDPKGKFDGVSMFRFEDVSTLQKGTPYLNKLVKSTEVESIYSRGQKDIQTIQKFTFGGFASAFEKYPKVVEVSSEREGSLTGKLLTHDNDILVMEEFDAKHNSSIGKAYINFSSISRMAIDVPWTSNIKIS